MTKKVISFWSKNNVHPRSENPGFAYAQHLWSLHMHLNLKCQRRVLGIRWQDFISIVGDCWPAVSLFGHVRCLSPGVLAHDILQFVVNLLSGTAPGQEWKWSQVELDILGFIKSLQIVISYRQTLVLCCVATYGWAELLVHKIYCERTR